MNNLIHASILDRLIDLETDLYFNNKDKYFQPVQSQYISINQLKKNIVRDLELLLNTSRVCMDLDNLSFKHIKNQSLLSYGLEEFINKTTNQREELLNLTLDIKKNIEIFEPRLNDVCVDIIYSNRRDGFLNFRVTATIKHNDIYTCFDTSLNTSNKVFQITNVG